MALPELGGYLNKLNGISVFDGETFNRSVDETKTGQHQVILTPENSRSISEESDYAVKGVLKGGINFATQANWGALEADSYLGNLVANGGILKFLKGATDVATTLGGAKLETELESKKFYTGGSYITLPLEIRVLDNDNSGKAIKAAMLLMAMTTPRETNATRMNKALDEIIKLLPKAAEKVLKPISDLASTTGNVIKQGIKKGEKSSSKLIQNLSRTLDRGVSEIEGSDVRFTESPTTVQLQVGKWLVMNNMVVERVNTTFSPQMSEVGPMFADFSIDVSTRYKVVLGEKGFKRIHVGSDAGRVEIIQGNTESFT